MRFFCQGNPSVIIIIYIVTRIYDELINTHLNYRYAVAIMVAQRTNGRRASKLGATKSPSELPSPLSWVMVELHTMATLPSILAKILKE